MNVFQHLSIIPATLPFVAADLDFHDTCSVAHIGSLKPHEAQCVGDDEDLLSNSTELSRSTVYIDLTIFFFCNDFLCVYYMIMQIARLKHGAFFMIVNEIEENIAVS